MWHVYQAVPTGNVEVRRAFSQIISWRRLSLTLARDLPVPFDFDQCVSDLSTGVDSFDSTAVLNSLLGISICKESLEHFLGQVKLSRIPSTLLLKVIHPPKTFPPEQMLKALLQRSLDGSTQYSISQSDWKHVSQLEVIDDVEIVGDRGDGMANALVPTQKSANIYKWSWEILNDLASWVHLGFICQADGDDFEERMLRKTLRDVPSSTVLSFNPEQRTAEVSRRDYIQNLSGRTGILFAFR